MLSRATGGSETSRQRGFGWPAGAWRAVVARSALQNTTELAADTVRVERCGIWLFVEERRAIRCFDLFERSSRIHSEGTILRAHDFPAYFAALERMRVVQADDARWPR